jgi:hypothetical protein
MLNHLYNPTTLHATARLFLGFGRRVPRLKDAPHDEKDIDVPRVGLGSNVTPEDDQARHSICPDRQLMDASQTCGDGHALRGARANVRDDLG